MLLGRKLKARTPKVEFSELLPLPCAGPARQAELGHLNVWMRYSIRRRDLDQLGTGKCFGTFFGGDSLYRCFYANAQSLQAQMGNWNVWENTDAVGIKETW